MAAAAGVARPARRGARVVYREAPGSDDENMEYGEEDTKVILLEKQDLLKEDDSNDSDYSPTGAAGDPTQPRVQSWPPLTDIQRQFRQVCRLGDRAALKHFLTESPGLQMDVKCHDGTTVLNEAVTKTAQFTGIVEVLVDFGARLDVCDSLGNSPLHNAVLYHPSTQDTVDLLLARGADTTATNYENQTPLAMADDKDLKEVLKELKSKTRGGKNKLKESSRESLYSAALRGKVTSAGGLDRLRPETVVVRFNHRPPPASPGLLKRRPAGGCEGGAARPGKRKRSCEEEEGPSTGRRGKRIRWVEADSTGAMIDPAFSEEEGEAAGRLADTTDTQSVEEAKEEVFPPNSFPIEKTGAEGSVEEAKDDDKEEAKNTEGSPAVWREACLGRLWPLFPMLSSTESPGLEGGREKEESPDRGQIGQGNIQVIEEKEFIKESVAEATEQTEGGVLENDKPSEKESRASANIDNHCEEGYIAKLDTVIEDTKIDSNENEVKKEEPLKIHMKANGDDSDLDSDFFQATPARRSVQFTGGFGFFVN